MKKVLLAAFCLIMLALAACSEAAEAVTVMSSTPDATKTHAIVSAEPTPVKTTPPDTQTPAMAGESASATPKLSSTPTPSASESESAAPAPAATPSPSPNESESVAPAPTATPSPSPAPTPRMYSSYAHLVSFDTKTGIAQFDYFDYLKGQDAVNYLVEREGYTLENAQTEVANWPDSMFIEKNSSSQLRAVDLSSVPIYMIIDRDGYANEYYEPIKMNYKDFKNLYNSMPAVILDTYFYRVKVDDSGAIESITQIYQA